MKTIIFDLGCYPVKLLFLISSILLGSSCQGDQQQIEEQVEADSQDNWGEQGQEEEYEENYGQEFEMPENVGENSIDEMNVANFTPEETQEPAGGQEYANEQLANSALLSDLQEESGDLGENINNTGFSEFEGTASQVPQASSDMRVKYIIANQQPLYSTPGGGTSTVSLEKGDHPLVKDNGEWSQTSDGHFVPSDRLSQSPIGRYEPQAKWR